MSRSLDKTVNVSGLVFNAAAGTPAIHFALAGVEKKSTKAPFDSRPESLLYVLLFFKSRNGAVTLNALITMVINV